MKHSESPWVYEPSEEAIYSSTGQPVVYETNTNGDDINLICAAPEMLQALQTILMACIDSEDHKYGNVSATYLRNIIEPAINKAIS